MCAATCDISGETADSATHTLIAHTPCIANKKTTKPIRANARQDLFAQTSPNVSFDFLQMIRPSDGNWMQNGRLTTKKSSPMRFFTYTTHHLCRTSWVVFGLNRNYEMVTTIEEDDVHRQVGPSCDPSPSLMHSFMAVAEVVISNQVITWLPLLLLL